MQIRPAHRPQGSVEYTDEQIVASLREKKGSVYLAAAAIGCHADTIYARAKTSEAVATCLKEEDGKVDDVAEMVVYQALLAEDKALALRAAMYRLSTKGKHRGYSEKTEVEHSGNIGGGFEDMTDEELEAEVLRLDGLRAAAAATGSAAGSA